MDPAYSSPQWAKHADLDAGDTVELHGFDCASGTVTIERDIWGSLFFPCAEGKHYVAGQLDENGYLIGITISPSAKVIPITQEYPSMNLNTDDANSVSRFFQSLADKVVLASTLPKEVEDLRAAVDQLKKDVEAYREHNARMDEEISNLRKERQALQDENAILRSDLNESKTQQGIAETRWSQACSERDRWHNDYIALSTTHEDMKRAKDDADMRIMELEDQLNRVRENCSILENNRDEFAARLNSIRSALA